jgi:probable F420-dependent oxidoreductase
MRIGLSTPIVVQVPGVASEWEATATVDDLATVAKVADEAGFEFLTCSEHVAIPSGDATRRGVVYWDPLATLGFLAAHTRRIRLATAVLVLGYHHPLDIAKGYGTLDRICAGRVVLGVGIGSLKEEFDLIGAVWPQRAARADDAIRALRATLGRAEGCYSGRFHEFSARTVMPHAARTDVPIWVGGRTAASLQRAVSLADGWMPFGLDPSDVRVMLDNADVPTGFEVMLGTGQTVDPSGDPVDRRTRLLELAGSGATVAYCTIAAHSVEHYCEQLIRLADIAATLEGNTP